MLSTRTQLHTNKQAKNTCITHMLLLNNVGVYFQHTLITASNVDNGI